MLFEKLVIAVLMIFVCTLVHAGFMIVGNRALDWRLTRFGPVRGHFDGTLLIWLMILWMFFAILIEAVLWALLYLYHPSSTSLTDTHAAFYFSMVTYTTLGYGDVVLTGDWRVLSAIQAATGVIIFGWTTALIYYYIQRIFKSGRSQGQNGRV
jgi:hypothetical protein